MSAFRKLLNASEPQPITINDALEIATTAPLPELGWAANRVCEHLHPRPIRTYVIDRNINYTNICLSGCRFCAFYRPPGHPEGYLLTTEQILNKIDEAVSLGATQILLQGGLHPELDIRWFEALFRTIKERYDVRIHSLSAPEIVHISELSGLTIGETLGRLRDSGLGSIPGGGAEILVNEVRSRVSPRKCTAQQWAEVMLTAAKTGLRATATMVFGLGETWQDRIAHLDLIRRIQEQSGVFTAFIPWPFQPGNTDMGGQAAGTHVYLTMLGISRLFLRNVVNIQASWVTQGNLTAQLALNYGANDAGSTMIEENVVAAAGVFHRMNESEIISMIHSSGFDAAQRDTDYNILTEHTRPTQARI